MVELFDYEGLEWFNVGTGCLLIALLFLTQLFWCVTGNQANLWFYIAINLAGFSLLGLALISKKPVPAIGGVVTTFFMAFSNMHGQFGVQIHEPLMFSLGVISLCVLMFAIADIIFEFTKIDVKQNYLVIASFVFMLVWGILRFAPVIQGTGWANKSIPMMWETALLASILGIVFAVVGIIAMLKEIKIDLIPSVEPQLMNNIAFLLCVLLFIVALVRWNAGGLFQLFG